MLKHVKYFIAAIMLTIVAGGCGYNAMQQMEEQVFRSWSDVESNLQRRADLIPNLVATVKGFAAHEKETLQAVVEARAKATSVKLSTDDLGSAQAMQQMLDAQGGLSSALSRLMVVVERYPDLKANQNFLDLQNQLEGTENRINVARQRYNKAVEVFNAKIRSLPYSLTNSFLLHLDRKEYFKAETGATQAPKINFD
ncbi:LemA family protein [Desulfosarcina variabilis str. Montpellier]|uniref:LemA family protein n=1 Tax=Desulfosarcina variabilis TaxID=2300 RepID=UPI003AFB44B0